MDVADFDESLEAEEDVQHGTAAVRLDSLIGLTHSRVSLTH